jgi:hypothetical protein
VNTSDGSAVSASAMKCGASVVRSCVETCVGVGGGHVCRWDTGSGRSLTRVSGVRCTVATHRWNEGRGSGDMSL